MSIRIMNFNSYMNRGTYMNNEQIVNSIKEICKKHNITVTKLEENLGMSQGLIGRWNKSDPSLSKIIDIADYFHTTIDEIIGYNNINDKFIEKLISQTSIGELSWFYHDESTPQLKKYTDMNYYKFKETYFQTHLFSRIKKGYIYIYCVHDEDVLKPQDLKLLIQPNDNAQSILQDYSKEQLLPLWLKILYSLKENAPDQIKAEELKYAFLLEENDQYDLKKQTFNNTTLLSNPSLSNLIEALNTPEVQKLQQTFSSPEFQKALKIANQINKI